MNDDEITELLRLSRENNMMLKDIIKYINTINANADNENNNDFLRNVIANLISTSLGERALRL